jgi:hypothetical protein
MLIMVESADCSIALRGFYTIPFKNNLISQYGILGIRQMQQDAG